MRAVLPALPVSLASVLLGLALAPPLVAQEPNAALVRSGRLTLALADRATSSLGVNVAALEATLCRPASRAGESSSERGSSAEDCHLVVGSGGPRDFEMVIDEPLLLPDNEVVSASSSASATELWFQGREEFTTACGRWWFDVILDPSVKQPSSTLHLHKPNPTDRVALFSGTLYAAVLVRFVRVDTGARRTIPITLELDAVGRWTVLDERDTPAGESNLSLFVDHGTAGFVTRPGCTQDTHQCGTICLEATPARLDALNGY